MNPYQNERSRGQMSTRKNEGTNVGKIIAITLAVVAGACAVIWFAMELYRKYCLIECDYDEEMDDESLFDDAMECEVVMGESAAEEAAVEA
jgi:hypothetical protein